jgi:oxaloacetate decarboxylase alpha subunit
MGPAPGGEAEAEEQGYGDAFIVTSPIVGTFYRAPEPEADPFTEVGEEVEEGQTLCIVEAMKLMNEIAAEVGGEVVAIFVENGEPVEYGQRLFAIRESE